MEQKKITIPLPSVDDLPMIDSNNVSVEPRFRHCHICPETGTVTFDSGSIHGRHLIDFLKAAKIVLKSTISMQLNISDYCGRYHAESWNPYVTVAGIDCDGYVMTGWFLDKLEEILSKNRR